MPEIIGFFVDSSKIPDFMGPTTWGHRFWGAFFTVRYSFLSLNLIVCDPLPNVNTKICSYFEVRINLWSDMCCLPGSRHNHDLLG